MKKKRKYNYIKIGARIKRIHHWVATVIKPDWTLLELKILICERLTNHELHFIVDTTTDYYSDMKKAAFNELTERSILKKEMIREDAYKIEKAYRKALSRR